MRETHVAAGRCAGALVLSMGLLAPAAVAQSGGSGGGGGMYVATPKVSKVSCVRRCASRSRAQGGSTLKLTGSGLGSAAKVVFNGSYGTRRRPVACRCARARTPRCPVRVPVGAVSGPVTRDHLGQGEVAADGAGRDPPAAAARAQPGAQPGPGRAGRRRPGRRDRHQPYPAYVGARRAVTFSFRLTGALATPPTVKLIRASDGATVKTWDARRGRVGRGPDHRLGRPARPHRRQAGPLLVPADRRERRRRAGAHAPRPATSERDSFDLYDNIFPIRGSHDYGGGAGRFGAGRAGHSHQGQDVFAKCGTPLVAARGGKIKFKQYHAAAGNYVVIDGGGHARSTTSTCTSPSPPRSGPGDRVYTGQRIGAVGDTGNADGCHLHFELWNPPGWYDGGRPFDPLPSLKAWDGWS